MPEDKREWEVHPNAAGVRVDQFLAQRIPDFSRAYIQKLVDEGQATVDGSLCRRSQRLRPFQILELNVPAPTALDVQAEDIPLHIVYEDEHLLVVNKAVGMVVHPNTHDRDGTLVNALLHHCDDLSGINGVERPGIVHRIDKDTSGLLLVAKHDKAHHHLSDQFREHSTERLYIALVYGGAPQPDDGTITTWIGRDPRDRKRMASVDGGGKHAITHYKVSEDYGPCAMVECSLDTGRTHQIRVHMSEMGHPLIGDPVYGGLGKKRLPADPKLRVLLTPIRGQMLHAATLGFIHPATDKYTKFQIAPPERMMNVIRGLRASARMDPEAEGPWDNPNAPSFGRRNALVPDYEAESY